MRSFRCPFEVKGELDKSIIEVRLSWDRMERLTAIKKGFELFHNSPASPGLRLILPPEARGISSTNKELKLAILPFQCEVLAAEIDYRLYPLMSYQMQSLRDQGIVKEEMCNLFKQDPYKALVAHAFNSSFQASGLPVPKTVLDIVDWLIIGFYTGWTAGIQNPMLPIVGPLLTGELINHMSIYVGTLVIHYERDASIGRPNKNCFSIVKSPFYPKAFGRYSDQVEIVLSREADFSALSPEARRKIRKDSNEVLVDHGIAVNDIENDKLESAGVWVPEYDIQNK